MPKAAAIFTERKAAQSEKAAAAGLAKLKEAAAEKGAVQTDSGLVYLETLAGDASAASPGPTDKVHHRVKSRGSFFTAHNCWLSPHGGASTGARPEVCSAPRYVFVWLQVRVHYEGTLIDGSVFDSSIARGATPHRSQAPSTPPNHHRVS